MPGATADRELSTETKFAVANRSHDSAIRRLLRETPMGGGIGLTFEREPDYFRGENIAGGTDHTILAWSDERLVCMGRCSEREYWINGAPATASYLAELRLHPAASGRLRVLREGYEFFRELQKGSGSRICFTSIGAGNERARRLLESGRSGLPQYTFLQELTTLLIAIPRWTPSSKLNTAPASEETIPVMLRLLNEHGKRHQLSAVWSTDALTSVSGQGLAQDRFLIVNDGGRAAACAALWDQRGFRQTVVRHYPPALAAVRPILNAASRMLGRPPLPAVGAPLSHAFLSPMAFARGSEEMIDGLVAAFFPIARRLGFQYLTLALTSQDPRLGLLRRRFSTRSWESRLYRVDWPGDDPPIFRGDSAILPEVALL